MRILFVENHALFAATVVEQFLCSHDVTVVPSIAAGLKAVGTGPFDAVLVDYDLDDGKGDQLVRALRGRRCDVPIVAVSARDEGNLAMADAGADAACPKRGFAKIEHAIRNAQDAVAPMPCRIHFDPPRAGWTRMLVGSGSEGVEIDVSYTPRDSLGELASALVTLLRSDLEGTVEFNSEPAVTLLKLRPSGDQIELTLEHHAEHRRHDHAGTLMLQRRAPKRPVVLAFSRAFRALRTACSPDVYEREWHHAFPGRAIEQIEEALGRET